MENEPTNKDLQHLIKDIKESVAQIKEKDLPEINNRAKTTNGSVADIVKWRERMVGAMWALGIVGTLVVIPLMTWAFMTISDIPEEIDKSVEQAFQNKADKVK